LQYDVKNAFLHADIDVPIYCKLPDGLYNDNKYNNKVALLRKALYGLKQAPRLWYLYLLKVLLDNGFKKSEYDSGVFYHTIYSIIIVCHVDDCMVVGPNRTIIEKIMNSIRNNVKIELMGSLTSFLGNDIDINYEDKTVKINQTRYTRKLLSRFEIIDNPKYKPCNTPGIAGLRLHKNKYTATEANILEYQKQIGSLLYLALKSRAEIAYSVCYCARFMSNPAIEHFKAVDRIWSYLLKYPDLAINYNCNGNLELRGYTDSDWAGDPIDRKSTGGYVFSLGDYTHINPISWTSQLQKTIALSSTEAEYMALKESAKEAIYLFNFISELNADLKLHIDQKIPLIFTDNEGSINLSKNPEFHKRTKHIDIHYHYTRNLVNENKLDIKYVPTKEQIADIMTKFLPEPLFNKFRGYLAIR
jgi:hypothetical protein